MPVNKQTLNIPFALGLDTKNDPWQIQPGNFLLLENAVFQRGNALKKRNGYSSLQSLPTGANATTLTTYKNNLTAIGNALYAYSAPGNEWINKGRIQPISLTTKSTVRTASSISVVDSAVSDNGLICTTFLDGDGVWKYTISSNTTGETLINVTALPSTAGQARVHVLGNYFVITFLRSSNSSLSYIAIPTTLLSTVIGPTILSGSIAGPTAGYDAHVIDNTLYIAWADSSGAAMRVTRLTSTLTNPNFIIVSGHTATLVSLATLLLPNNTPRIWVTAYSGNNAYSFYVDFQLSTYSTIYHTITATTCMGLTSVADENGLTLFYQVYNTYSFPPLPAPQQRTDFINKVTCTNAGVVSAPVTIQRDAGLGSEAFIYNDTIYLMVAHDGLNQPTYFLIDSDGNIVSKLAYANGAGYCTTQIIPSVTLNGSIANIAYLYKTLVIPVNKSQGTLAPNGVYAQIGGNIVEFDLDRKNVETEELAQTLNIAGGQLWMYDSVMPVEQSFHVWPDEIYATYADTGGSIAKQQYYYQITYEWTDGEGYIHRSAPSIPISVEITTGGATHAVTLQIPTLRFTAKDNVRIVIYRWSTAQQIYYQVTDITGPGLLLNNPNVDSVQYVDTKSDAQILGNTVLYTTGGVVENIGPPACSQLTTFNNRLFLVSDEDRNTIWYSKQVLASTPVEFSDFFTIYVAPTSTAQGDPSQITAIAAMDDKLIIFKRNTIYYVAGVGPDITGANNDFTDPVFITSTVGCTNANSIVYSPQGIFFQSNKGIWVLNRNLTTEYIGAPVAAYNQLPVSDGLSIPNTNEIRMSVEPNVSMAIYNGYTTLLNASGSVAIETPDVYVDGLNAGLMLLYDYYYQQWGTFKIVPGPVQFAFTTAWFSLAGIQGFERSYWMNILGRYVSPHKLSISVCYNFNDSAAQQLVLTSQNYAGPYGSDPIYGDGSPYGGPGNVEQWRVFFNQQKCQSFQLRVQEIFDPQYGTAPGAGIQLTGINLVVGLKSSYPRVSAAQQVS